jgi:hypothetical protein
MSFAIFLRSKILGVLCLMCVSAPAFAQGTLEPINGRDLRDLDRGREGLIDDNPADRFYEPVTAGSFLLYPILKLEQSYDDNILARDNAEENSLVTSVAPRLLVQKQAGRHSFELDTKAEIRRAYSESSENTENYHAHFRSTLEARHDIKIPLSFGYEHAHDDRFKSRSSAFNDTPYEYAQASAATGIIYNPNRLNLKLIGRAAHLNLENNTDRNTAAPIIRDGRDRNSYEGLAEIGYMMRPHWNPFLRASVQKEDFKRRAWTGTDFTGNDQDNILLRSMAGLRMDYEDRISGEISLGMDRRDYDQAGIDTTSDLAAQAFLSWQVSPRSKLSLDVTRFSVSDNDVVSGVTATSADARLDYELRSDIFLNARAGYGIDDFDQSTREDDRIRAGLGIDYIAGPNLRLGAEYGYESRDSNQSALDFSRNLFLMRATGAL